MRFMRHVRALDWTTSRTNDLGTHVPIYTILGVSQVYNINIVVTTIVSITIIILIIAIIIIKIITSS